SPRSRAGRTAVLLRASTRGGRGHTRERGNPRSFLRGFLPAGISSGVSDPGPGRAHLAVRLGYFRLRAARAARRRSSRFPPAAAPARGRAVCPAPAPSLEEEL